MKNWINEALEKIGAVCEKKQTKDLEEIKDENENLKIWINKALEKIGAVCEKKQAKRSWRNKKWKWKYN